MYSRLTPDKRKLVDSLFASLTDKQKIGQTFCIKTDSRTPEQMAAIVEEYSIGSLFYAYQQKDACQRMTETVNRNNPIPVIVNADLVNGAGSRIPGCTLFPWQLAVGAADSQELAEKMGMATAIEGADAGIHWTFGPVVDPCYNIFSSMMNIRTFGQDPERIIRIANAFVRGAQQTGLMAATAKHFPGDGVDDRDTHLCTTQNSFSETEWRETYGRIWKSVIDAGVMSIMPGHMGLPWKDPGNDFRGPPPATLSSKLQIELLREELGFQGVIVSDAIPMVGFSSWYPREERIPLNVETGSDVILWVDPQRDLPNMEKALDKGLLSQERLDAAAKNVLALKAQLGLLDETPRAIPAPDTETYQLWSDQIGERSVHIVRDEGNTLPLSLPSGAKVLTITCGLESKVRGTISELNTVNEELAKRGYQVTHLRNPTANEAAKAASESDAVFLNMFVLPRYGANKLDQGIQDTLRDCFWNDHPCVVFTNFGDPFKLYEMPYVHNYVNCYSNAPASQKAAVKLWFGEIEAADSIPVSLDGFFEMSRPNGATP